MAHLDPVVSARAPYGPLVHSEDHGFALRQGYDLDPRLHARALLGQNEFTPVEIPLGRV